MFCRYSFTLFNIYWIVKLLKLYILLINIVAYVPVDKFNHFYHCGKLGYQSIETPKIYNIHDPVGIKG